MFCLKENTWILYDDIFQTYQSMNDNSLNHFLKNIVLYFDIPSNSDTLDLGLIQG